MALLTLKDIGKIYVSEGNVTVGIRGVNLSFDRGEFVAITGKSGSGKSTLLNVISGMDSYEEGELYVEGRTTSHYLQTEWEEYREKYISFIFQDYNIIESFTVLENVELALMNIENARERRERALALIERVGLSSHKNHKGSKLSGGQKQRTVIARALAKNSPIILADEPTGNLDSKTSKEIIELLYEISKDKLVIVVTHNFDELESCATRHVRIFDGAVEFDHRIRPHTPCKENEAQDTPSERKEKSGYKNIKNGLTLGKSIFLSKPKLSVFLCLLLLIGTLGIFTVTSLCGGAADIFKPHYMFNDLDGRVIITTTDGSVLTEDEIKTLCEEYGADSYLRFDALLDLGSEYYAVIPVGETEADHLYFNMECSYGEDFGDGIIGRYPEKENEVLLYLPISFKTALGDAIDTDELFYDGMNLKIVGIKYYYDNNLSPKCLFTGEGFRVATAAHYLQRSSNVQISVSVTVKDGSTQKFSLDRLFPSFDMESGKIFVDHPSYQELIKEANDIGLSYESLIKISSDYYKDDLIFGAPANPTHFEKTFKDSDTVSQKPSLKKYYGGYEDKGLIISDEALIEIAETVLNDTYKQASLFFENDEAAREAAEKLCDAGYIAVPSDTTYEPDVFTTLLTTLSSLMLAFAWFIAIIFLAFFINLSSSRVIGAFKEDMEIMRSMGIPVAVIRIGMYVRMLISLLPAFVLVILTAILIFTAPSLNAHFVYLYAWQYALMFIGMLILTLRVTHKQIRKLFGESVKKSLKGGEGE